MTTDTDLHNAAAAMTVAEAGRRGGSVTGGAKADAARENGKQPVRAGSKPRGWPKGKSRKETKMNTDLNLLDCIAHGTSYEDFLKSFRGPNKASKAAAHLRKFYIENGGDETDSRVLDDAERAAKIRLESM